MPDASLTAIKNVYTGYDKKEKNCCRKKDVVACNGQGTPLITKDEVNIVERGYLVFEFFNCTTADDRIKILNQQSPCVPKKNGCKRIKRAAHTFTCKRVLKHFCLCTYRRER